VSVLDPKDLRRAFGSFATGVTVVTTRAVSQEPVGFTANSFSSVSLDPPLVSVCPATGMLSFPVFAAASTFAVNILAEDQQDMASVFASRGADKFAHTRWRPGTTGSPILEGVVASFDCVVHERVPAGDHVILIGRVVDYAYNDRAPLGFCGGAYVRFGLQQRAMELGTHDERLRIGAVLECEGAVLLEEDPRSGTLSVPTASQLGDPEDTVGLYGKFAAAGFGITLPFLFAVYEDAGTQFVVHRGHASPTPDGLPKSTIQRFALDEIPWSRIARPAERLMLERYRRERETNVTGIYVGTAESGELHTVSASQRL
jgi:flavin reductase (DIM6/NTAB) family NADH-FMN oxidoreductase RutF